MKQQEIIDILSDMGKTIDEVRNIAIFADPFGTPNYDKYFQAMQLSSVNLLCTDDTGRVVPIAKSFSDTLGSSICIHQVGEDADPMHAVISGLNIADHIGDSHYTICFLHGEFLGQFDTEGVKVGSGPALDVLNQAIDWTLNAKLPKGTDTDCDSYECINFFDCEEANGEYLDIEYDKNYHPIGIEYVENVTSEHLRGLFWSGYEMEMSILEKHGPDWRDNTIDGVLSRIDPSEKVIKIFKNMRAVAIHATINNHMDVIDEIDKIYRRRVGITKGRIARSKSDIDALNRIVDEIEEYMKCFYSPESEKSSPVALRAVQLCHDAGIDDAAVQAIVYSLIAIAQVNGSCRGIDEYVYSLPGEEDEV